jgi:hypothetical protein
MSFAATNGRASASTNRPQRAKAANDLRSHGDNRPREVAQPGDLKHRAFSRGADRDRVPYAASLRDGFHLGLATALNENLSR